MPIRPIDLQTMIPKLPEVQKAKEVENNNPKINIAINIHKEQEKNVRKTKKVNEAEKAYNKRISREDKEKDKDRQGKREKREENKKDKQDFNTNKRIDIRI